MYHEMEAAMKCFCSSYKLKCTQITKTTIPKKTLLFAHISLTKLLET